MSDEQNSGTGVPPSTPASGGAFEWLIESHQQSEPMAPLPDDAPAPAPAPLSFDLINQATMPPAPLTDLPTYELPPPVPDSVPTAAAPAAAAPPVYVPRVYEQPVYAPVYVQPTEVSPVTPAPTPFPPVPQTPPPLTAVAPSQSPIAPETQSAVFNFAAEPGAASTFGGGLALERHTGRARSGNRPLDGVAFVLAFLAPPIGLILGVVAVVTGLRTNGYAASIAKVAIGIGAALSLVLGVGYVVESKIANDHAAHAALVASSAAWCTKLKANPATLASDTFGWPAPGDTIPASITAIKAYESKWDSLAAVAPAGIRADTRKVAATAKWIAATVQSTQTLGDAGNVVQLQNVVATSGIQSWVSSYCG